LGVSFVDIKRLYFNCHRKNALEKSSSAEMSKRRIPATLTQPGVVVFWLAVLLTGVGAGVSAAVLTVILQWVQQLAWPATGSTVLESVTQASPWRHIVVLAVAGLVTGAGQIALVRLTSANGIEITAAIWFNAGRLPAFRTLGSALLSVVVVGMGASLGREGAPKQVGAVVANALADRGKLSDEQRRLLVACGAGAGMAGAYGVPLGGALFALEVLRGELALRLVLPALMASLIATGVAWAALPDAPTYPIPSYVSSLSVCCWALLAGPLAGIASVGYVKMIPGRTGAPHAAGADWSRPLWYWGGSGWSRSGSRNCSAMAGMRRSWHLPDN
jgi:H+/Cl- antiporter ClcA